ncbi:MAG: aminoglycoside phosphotransferase family protein [Actinobacteria bacterium]|nr:MAG: aminoglycoside phosphotransferase family protein [Actinomycetota bacterium]
MAGWIEDTLRAGDLEPSGPIEHLRTRPWSALARVPTTQGDLFFKAVPPGLAFEPTLTLALARKQLDHVPEVVAIDCDRRWVLMRDAGPQLRETLAGSDDPRIWDELLPLYARLQLELGESVKELLALGTPDDRPQALRAAFEDLLPRWRLESRFAALAPVIEDYAGRLSDTVPASVIHEEFNDNNIHLGAEGPVVLDWGEAAVGHPFAGLVVTMRGLVDRWGFEPGGPELRRLRDVYLEPWAVLAPLPELIELFALAYPLGMVSRALAWDRILATLGEADAAEFSHTVPAWLDVLHATMAGTATLGT